MKSIFYILSILLLFIYVGIKFEENIVNNTILMNKFSYYGTIITYFSLIVTFFEIKKAKDIQQKIKEEIDNFKNQKSLQNNSKLQDYLSKLRDSLQNKQFEYAKVHIDFLKQMLPSHNKYKEIISAIDEELDLITNESGNEEFKTIKNIGFFQHLETRISRVTRKENPKILEKDKDEFMMDIEFYSRIIARIDNCLTCYVGEQS